ncbi:MAG: queuosine salvage family protein [Candidatus Riflebacteria bacterium]|nr:queuosine salvage family protein [Candidatus Riflebacteria bacterium]
MKPSVFDKIRSSCAFAAEKAELVHINQNFLEEYALILPIEIAQNPIMESENHFCGDAEATLAYFITLDCINFGSGYFAALRKDQGKTGYFTVASRLKAEALRVGGFSAAWLKTINSDECCRIFDQSPANAVAYELMCLFAKALSDLAALLEKEFGDSFIKLIESASYSAAALTEILCQMSFYRDIFKQQDREIFLLKRAQITASDLHIAFSGQGFGRFDDISELTIFADNLVPHVLLTDGLLSYAPDLQAAIAANELLASGSQAELEIRASSVHAVELLRQTYLATGTKVSSQGLDYLLWNRGQDLKYLQSPTHVTRCVYY